LRFAVYKLFGILWIFHKAFENPTYSL